MNNERSCSCGGYNNDSVLQNDRSGSCGCGCGCSEARNEAREAAREAREAAREARESRGCGCGCNRERTGFFCCLNRLLGGENRSENGSGNCCRRERRCGCGCRHNH